MTELSSSDTIISSPPPHSPATSSTSPFPSSSCSPNDFLLITPLPLESFNPQFLVSSPSCGGVSIFLGTTRNSFEGRRVVHLSYEAYQQMAEKELSHLASDMRQMWNITRLAIIHRIGIVPVGSCSVLIAASSEHRRDCLDAVSWAIDEVKRRLPVWKKEVYDDGSVWKQNSEFDVPNLIKQTTDVIVDQYDPGNGEGKTND